MKVVWVNEAASLVGGAERYVWETAALLRARGVRSTLLYDVGPETSPRMLEAFDAAFPAVDVARQLRELAPDVVYAHQIGRPEVLTALESSRAPVFRFFHDHHLFCLRDHKYTALGQKTCERPTGIGCYPCLGFVNRSESFPGLRIVTLGALERQQRQNRGFAGFVVGSTYMADHVAAHGFSRERIHVVPLYASLPGDAGQGAREQDLLLFVGALTTGKGIDVLFGALRRMRRPARLVLVGEGRQGARLRELAVTEGLGARVTFVGKVGPEALAQHYRRAACLVLPSRAPETFGLVGLEAMSHGTPVVATSVGGMLEWLEPERTGLAVPSGDPVALAQALDRILGDPEEAEAMGRRGRERHRAAFLPEHHVDRLLRVLGEEI